MTTKRVDYYSWLIGVFAWDGVLPALIVVVL